MTTTRHTIENSPYPRPSSRHARASPSLTVEPGAGAVRSVAVAAAAEADATRFARRSRGRRRTDGPLSRSLSSLARSRRANWCWRDTRVPSRGEGCEPTARGDVHRLGFGFGNVLFGESSPDATRYEGARRVPFTSRTPTSSSSGVPTSSSRRRRHRPGGADVLDVAPEMACRAHARGAVRATPVVAARTRGARVLVRRQNREAMVSTNRRVSLRAGGARAAVETVCFSPCGAYLALGAADGSLSAGATSREPPGDDETGGRRRRDVGTDEQDFDRGADRGAAGRGNARVAGAARPRRVSALRERDAGTPRGCRRRRRRPRGGDGRRARTPPRADAGLPPSWGNWRARARAG